MHRSVPHLVGQYRLLIQRAHDPSLSLDDKVDMLEEAEYLKGYVAHLRKHSDITVLMPNTGDFENIGEYTEQYFGYIPIEATVDIEGLPSRRARKLKKEDIKRQLLAYYKYNFVMYKNKMKIHKILCYIYITLSKAFGMYGMDARFKYNETIVDSSELLRLKRTIRTFTKEFGYISRACAMRSMYGSYLPENFGGVHKIIILSDACLDWMSIEPSLSQFRDFLSDEEGFFEGTWCGKGIMTPYALETVFRLALRDNKFVIRKLNPKRTIVNYRYTSEMVQHLVLPSDNPVYINNLKVRSVVALMRTDPTTPLQERLLYGKSNADERDEFLYEMEAIQQFADQVIV